MRRKGLCFSLGIVLLTCLPLSPLADELPFDSGTAYLTPMAGGIVFLDDSDVDVDHSFIVGGRIGYFLNKNFSLESDFDYSWTEFNSPLKGLNANHYFALVNALYHFREIAENLAPYLLGGVGWGFLETGPFDEDGFVGNVGTGLHYRLSDHLLLRGEVRGLFLMDPNESNVTASVGLTLPIGGKEEAPPPPPPAPVWSDFDEDGVHDDQDKCPGTPKGCRVDGDGCPSDADLDGVCDGLDDCPSTPRGCRVDRDGCQLDSDGDGVWDGLDQCPDTPRDTPVDERGCQIVPEKVTIGWTEGLRFEHGSAKLTTQGEDTLDRFVKLAREYPKTVIEIGGYTDSSGSEALNQRLSEKRAMAVRNYLVLKGITPDRLIPVGYGETNFIADNSTPEGMAQNRRVEFKFLDENALGLKLLHFKPGKSDLTEASLGDLDEVAWILKAHPGVKIEIATYTDSSGSAGLNKRLSQKRAEAVRDLLVAKGVPAGNLKPVGYGASNYLTTNDTAEGRNMNRRIEFLIPWR